MRLINTSTYVIEKFDDPSNAPSYAILSHTWGDDELELKDLRGPDAVQRAQQDTKVHGACILAQKQMPKLSHAWIDTICIDQSSSSDKSEAINAMYRYYREAKICFTILSDVDGNGVQLIESKTPDTPQMKAVRDAFTNARWFTRGWTLQELLAPTQFMFYDKHWNPLGSRDDLCNTIAGKTRIESAVLRDAQQLRACSIAKRMSWAAGRKTRRPEDVAYSLLGIFGVNMPMIYGEGGERAFIRLQEEIIKISDDHSLFAWPLSADPDNFAMLARSPAAFVNCSNIISAEFRYGNHPYSVTNRGVSMTLNLSPWSVGIYAAPINCYDLLKIQLKGSGDPLVQKCQMGIFLKREMANDRYTRVAFDGMDFMPSEPRVNLGRRRDRDGDYVSDHGVVWGSSEEIPVNVRRTILDFPPPVDLVPNINGFQIGPGLLELHNRKNWFWESASVHQWDAGQHVLQFATGQWEYSAVLNISAQGKMTKFIKLGFNFDFDPICYLARHRNHLIQPFITLRREDYNKWNTVETNSSMKLATPDRDEPKLWRLRGDRLRGLDVYLPGFGTKEVPRAHITFERVNVSNASVWRFDIENLGNESIWK
jgi:hypothetical protein